MFSFGSINGRKILDDSDDSQSNTNSNSFIFFHNLYGMKEVPEEKRKGSRRFTGGDIHFKSRKIEVYEINILKNKKLSYY